MLEKCVLQTLNTCLTYMKHIMKHMFNIYILYTLLTYVFEMCLKYINAHVKHTRHLWPLSRKCSFTCHTYYDSGQPFIICDLRGPVTTTPNAKQMNATILIDRLDRV